MTRCIALAAGAALVAGTAQAQVLIDNFDIADTVIANSGTPSDFSPLTPMGASSSFTDRQLGAAWLSGPNNVELVSDASGNSNLNYSTGSDTNGVGVVAWGNSVVDLTDGGALTGILVKVLFDDLPATLTFSAFDSLGDDLVGTINLPGGIFAPQDFFLPFASMTGPGDITDVELLQLDIEGQFPATDLQIDFIESNIPAPASLVLLGAGGLVASRRRR